MRELGRESERKLKPMRFEENKRSLLRADTRRSCKASSDERYQKAAALAEAGYGWGAIVMAAGVSNELAKALVLGE